MIVHVARLPAISSRLRKHDIVRLRAGIHSDVRYAMFMPSSLPPGQVQLIVAGAALFGGLCGWFGRGLGFVIARWITGAGRQERVAYMASLADLMNKLRSSGQSVADVSRFEAALRSSTLADSDNVASMVVSQEAMEIDQLTTSFAMRSRALAKYDVAAAQLDQTVVDLRLVLEESEVALHLKAQEQWQVYRTALMEAAEGQYAGGTLGIIVSILVGLAETERRNGELRQLVDARTKQVANEERLITAARDKSWLDKA